MLPFTPQLFPRDLIVGLFVMEDDPPLGVVDSLDTSDLGTALFAST